MNKIKDKKIIVLVLILVIFSIAYFVVVNKISYAFEDGNDLKLIYESKIETITECAKKYGENNLNEFNEEGIMYITVQDLIDNNYLSATDNGKIINILNINENLNNKKIRIKKEANEIIAEIYS